MTRDDIIRMARDAGLKVGPSRDGPDDVYGVYASLARFADLVAAAERERLKQSIRHSLTIGPKTIQTRVYFGEEEVSMVKMPIEEVVAVEREACADMVEDMDVQHPKYIAAAIRARGKK